MSKIDWNAPIEAVHDDGRVVSAGKLDENRNIWPDSEGQYHVKSDAGVFWSEDGSDWMGLYPGWRIRNVAAPETATRPSDELVERMIALVNKMTDAHHDWPTVQTMHRDHYQEAREILAQLPEPIDPDLIAAREIVASQYEAGDMVSWAKSCREGHFDNALRVQAALAGIKHGRAQEKRA